MTSGTGKGNLTADITMERHRLVSGLHENLGGKDEGPDPHRLLEASLTACTILTVELYAKRKQWDLRTLEVSVTIDSETKEGTKITRKIGFDASVSAEQRERLLEIANKCPIHKLLTGSVAIDTLLS